LVESGDKQTMTALSRGIRVLQCFSTADPELSSKDLTDRTGLARPTIFRITSTLRQIGLLRYSESRMVFAPTSRLLTLGTPVLANMKVRHLARPMMQQLAELSAAQVLLSSGSAFEVVVVEAVMGSKSEVFRPEIGTRLSLSRTAIGRAHLLTLPPQERARYLRQVATADPERGRILEAKLQEDEDHFRLKGYLKARREARPDVVGTAVPMQSVIDGQTFIFSCTIPPFSADDEQLDALGVRLASLVRNVEASMGNLGDFSPSHREIFPEQSARRRAAK
jgi:DNA-binding IclR family transcriptional regulator